MNIAQARRSVSIDNVTTALASKLFNYSFNCTELLSQALISHSLVEEKHLSNYHEAFNRLAFLGDSILLLIISELVFLNFPKGNESLLTNIKTAILNNETLGAFVIEKGVSKLIVLTKGEDKMNMRESQNKMSEVLKAICGAIYLDCNRNISKVKKVIRDFIKPILKNVFSANSQFVYYKKDKEKNKNKDKDDTGEDNESGFKCTK